MAALSDDERHAVLLARGWHYDTEADRWRMPTGIAWYTLTEAWKLHETAMARRDEEQR